MLDIQQLQQGSENSETLLKMWIEEGKREEY